MTQSLRALLIAVAAVALVAAGCGADDPGADSPKPSMLGLVGDGLSDSVAGYQISRPTWTGKADQPGELQFQIRHGKAPVIDYLVEQEREIHLYLVRENLSEFRHLHPTLDRTTGTWAVTAEVGGGEWRVIAEFHPADSADTIVLGTNVAVPGGWEPAPFDPPTTGSDGSVEVTVVGKPRTGDNGAMTIAVRDRSDRPLTLETYLGAWAHVTAFNLETGELVHMHPLDAPAVDDFGTRLSVHTTFGRSGDWVAWVQVRVAGFLHTIPIRVEVIQG